ncbi:MAG TPA: DUF3224 domain-containing protein [bacterium]
MKAKATYKVEKWKEDIVQQISPDMKITKASVVYALTGEITGKASVEYIMFYKHFDSKDPHQSLAEYVGLMNLEGELAGKSGSLSLEDIGTFEGGTAVSSLRIIEGSGTGELKGIKGSGAYRADQKSLHFELDYDL